MSGTQIPGGFSQFATGLPGVIPAQRQREPVDQLPVAVTLATTDMAIVQHGYAGPGTGQTMLAPISLLGAGVVLPYDVAGYYAGNPPPGIPLQRVVFPRQVTWTAGLPNSQALCTIAPANPVTMNVSRNGSSVGSINFAAGATVGTFTLATGFTFNVGDVLEIDPPSVGDPTFTSPCWTFAGSLPS